MAVALRGFTARGSPYTVRVLALKLEEEGEGTEVFDSDSKFKYLSCSLFILVFEYLIP